MSISYAPQSIDEMPLLNGAFDIWTDTTSITAANYIAVVWRCVALGTSGAATINQQSFTLGTARSGTGDGDPPGDLTYFLRWNQTTAATAGTPELQNRIEKVATFAGRHVIVQGWYRCNQPVTVGLKQNFGSGGSPTTAVALTPQTLPSTPDANGTVQWRRFARDFYLADLPASATLGSTANTDYLAVSFVFPLNVLFQFDLADVRITESSNPNPAPRRRPSWFEASLCERYHASLTAYAPVSTQSSGWVPFRRQMRAVPAMTGGTGSTLGTATVDGFPIISAGAAAAITGILADARL